MREKNDSRPAWRVDPFMIWPIRVWAPTQPMDAESPLSICSAISAGIMGRAG